MGSKEEKTFKAANGITAVTAEELGAKMTSGPAVTVPDDAMKAVQGWIGRYKTYLVERAKAYVKRQTISQERERRGLQPETGQPIVGPYVAWDVLMTSPIELTALPNQQPNKIVASGAITMLMALMWTNPTIDVAHGFAVPANIQLCGRTARVSFDQFNLNTAAVGPNITFVFPLPCPVPPLILIPAIFVTPAVANPQLVEVNVTADIMDPNQPYAAVASWHVDIDAEPPWFGGFPPGQPPARFHFDTPLRYLVYPQ